ncbi:MAG: diacylglycerol kinase family protein [Geitlerinemataceae cyanobacterium]
MPHSHLPSPSRPPERADRATVPLLVSPRTNRGSWKVATSLFASFRYAWGGIAYTFRTQRNFRIHVALGTVALGLSAWLNLPLSTITIVTLIVGAILVLELLNTAIEAVVDLCVGKTYHDLAKVAKDCAAGAVLLAAIAAVLVACILILPALVMRILSWF